jgi:hypothetical protein
MPHLSGLAQPEAEVEKSIILSTKLIDQPTSGFKTLKYRTPPVETTGQIGQRSHGCESFYAK